MRDYSEICQEIKVMLKDYYEAMSKKDYKYAFNLLSDIGVRVNELVLNHGSEDANV